jgi:hypothetical protein
MKCAVFSCLGLGDGLISLVLSNNLSKEGHDVITYHPFLSGLQDWFPRSRIDTFPKKEFFEDELRSFDKIFIFFEKTPSMAEVINFCKSQLSEKTVIINPIATAKTNYPYWENARFNGTNPFADNLQMFCRDILLLKDAGKVNGISPPSRYQKGKFTNRVILHPTSSRAGKNWPKKHFLSLAKALKKKGYEPCFILTDEERKDWLGAASHAPTFSHLSELAGYIYESFAMIGNDSGIGHLSSCLGLPTVTICRSEAVFSFWRPSWSRGCCVLPPPWIPNVKGLRLRDKYWRFFIPKAKVLKAFFQLVGSD